MHSAPATAIRWQAPFPRPFPPSRAVTRLTRRSSVGRRRTAQARASDNHTRRTEQRRRFRWLPACGLVTRFGANPTPTASQPVVRVHRQSPLNVRSKSLGNIVNFSGWPGCPSAVWGGLTTPGLTTVDWSARHRLVESWGVAVQSPDRTSGLRRPSPCSVIAGPTLSQRSLGGAGVATVCHRPPWHTSGIIVPGGEVLASA